MKRLLFLLFISGLFAIEISSVEITYGQPFESGDADNSTAHFLLNSEEKKSIKIKFIMSLNETSSLNYFVQYADYFNTNVDLDFSGVDFDLGIYIYDDMRTTYYNTGLQYQKHFNIKNRLVLKGSLSVGVMNKTISALGMENEETVKGFLGYGLGAGVRITDKLSIILDYQTILTNLGRDYPNVWDHFEKNTDHLYNNIELGLALNLK